MQTLRHIWLIALKDLKLFASDKLALFFAILFPFFFITMFYFMLGGIGGEDTRLRLYLVTQEKEGLSHDIIDSLVTVDESLLQPGETAFVRLTDYDTALQRVHDKALAGFLAFPEDFTRGIYLGYGTSIEVVANAQSTNTMAALNSLAASIASEINARQVVSDAVLGLAMEPGLSSGDVSAVAQAIQKVLPQLVASPSGSGSSPPLVTYDVRNVGAIEAINASNFVIPGYLVMFVFFTAALAAETIVRERKNQTLERLLASSVRREAILGGIFASTVFKGIIQIIIFWLMGIFAFKMSMGAAPGGVILLSVLMVIMSAAFSIMLATLAKSQRAASSAGVLLSLILAPLGGCWWPLFITPRWMQFLANFTPHGWATEGFNKMMVFGADFSAAIPNMLALVGFAVAFGLVAVLKFRTSD